MKPEVCKLNTGRRDQIAFCPIQWLSSLKPLSRTCSLIIRFLLINSLFTTSGIICAAHAADQNTQPSDESSLAIEQDKRNTDTRLEELLNKFRRHITALDIAPERVALQLSNASIVFSNIIEIEDSDFHDIQFPSWFTAGSPIPTDILDEGTLSKETFPDGKLPTDFISPSLLSAMYLGRLMYQRQCHETGKTIPIETDTDTTASEESTQRTTTLDKYAPNTANLDAEKAELNPDELRHLHQFLLAAQIWTQEDYEIVELAIARMELDKNNDFTTKPTFQPEIIC